MAAKWHVNGEGKPGKCSARAGKCPFGADAPHFGTRREAEAAAEALIAREASGFGGEAKAAALTECGDGSGLAVDAAGRWYRDGVLVENMVEATSDEGETVVLAGNEGASVVSDGNTNVRISGGSFGDLVNVGYYDEYGVNDENMSAIDDARVERGFGLVIGQVGGDTSIGVLNDYVEPGNPAHVTDSCIEDLWNSASVDVATGHTTIRGVMGEARVGVLTGKARVEEIGGSASIGVVESGGGVDYMLGRASVSEVRSHRREDGYMEHGRIGDMRDDAYVGSVCHDGFVGDVRGRASVDVVRSGGRVMEVSEDARVALVDAGGVVECVSWNARVGSVDAGGSVDKVTDRGAAVMNVGSGGRVGAVTGGATVVDVGSSDATEPCVVESVDSSSKVSLIDCWADVTYECGESNVSPARAREFVVKRLSDDATGIGGACLERANGDNPFERSNVRLRVRDAQGLVVDVPDVDGVLRGLVEVDDDEREMMWESMMGSPDSK